MAEVVVFHHAHGRTPGVLAFAEELRRAGHVVHVPDLYERQRFGDLDTGVSYARRVGFDTIIERGVRAVETLPRALVYAGFSLGVLPAQKLAQTRTGAAGAVLVSACVPAGEFGGWPDGVPLQIHAMNGDPFFMDEGDVNAARAMVATVDEADLYLYPGDHHLFADATLPTYDAAAATRLTERVIALLDGVE